MLGKARESAACDGIQTRDLRPSYLTPNFLTPLQSNVPPLFYPNLRYPSILRPLLSTSNVTMDSTASAKRRKTGYGTHQDSLPRVPSTEVPSPALSFIRGPRGPPRTRTTGNVPRPKTLGRSFREVPNTKPHVPDRTLTKRRHPHGPAGRASSTTVPVLSSDEDLDDGHDREPSLPPMLPERRIEPSLPLPSQPTTPHLEGNPPHRATRVERVQRLLLEAITLANDARTPHEYDGIRICFSMALGQLHSGTAEKSVATDLVSQNGITSIVPYTRDLHLSLV